MRGEGMTQDMRTDPPSHPGLASPHTHCRPFAGPRHVLPERFVILPKAGIGSGVHSSPRTGPTSRGAARLLMNATPVKKGFKKNAPRLACQCGFVPAAGQSATTPVCLAHGGSLRPNVGVRSPVSITRPSRAAVRRPQCKRHVFTFPSKAIAGAAVQFNSGLSIMPPPHTLDNSHTLDRRHDGYTASGYAASPFSRSTIKRKPNT